MVDSAVLMLPPIAYKDKGALMNYHLNHNCMAVIFGLCLGHKILFPMLCLLPPLHSAMMNDLHMMVQSTRFRFRHLAVLYYNHKLMLFFHPLDCLIHMHAVRYHTLHPYTMTPRFHHHLYPGLLLQ